jgi:hypothetical protein
MPTRGQALDTSQGLPAPMAAAVLKPDRPKRVYTWTCAFCGEDFETENYSQRYCKPSHKQRAYELRKNQRVNVEKQPESCDALTVT